MLIQHHQGFFYFHYTHQARLTEEHRSPKPNIGVRLLGLVPSGRGGTGRRTSFRGWRAQARAGSNPAAPTNDYSQGRRALRRRKHGIRRFRGCGLQDPLIPLSVHEERQEGRYRSIAPACRLQRDVFRRWDHPRVCGEHGIIKDLKNNKQGSSPRMRGTHCNFWVNDENEGIIPAYAGNTHFEIGQTTSFGIIPAYAGNTRRGQREGRGRRDHPRVCGEHEVARALNAPLSRAAAPSTR